MNIFKKIFSSTIKLNEPLYVQLVNSRNKKPIGTGHIVAYNTAHATLIVEIPSEDLCSIVEREVRIADIRTYNKMQDGRIRMWIKEGKI